MKLVTFVFPKNLCAEFAKYSFENNIKVLMSFSEEEFMSGVKVTVICAIADEKVEAAKSAFPNYFKG